MPDVPAVRVVLATNGSTACRRAIVRASTFFFDAQLVVAVVLPLDPRPCESRADETSELTGLSAVHCAPDQVRLRATAATISELSDVLGPHALGTVLHGDPAHALIRLATEERTDVIVVGSLSRAGGHPLLRPSIADELIAGAPCPVIELGR